MNGFVRRAQPRRSIPTICVTNPPVIFYSPAAESTLLNRVGSSGVFRPDGRRTEQQSPMPQQSGVDPTGPNIAAGLNSLLQQIRAAAMDKADRRS